VTQKIRSIKIQKPLKWNNTTSFEPQLEYSPTHIDYFEYFAPFEDSTKFMAAVNNSIKIFHTETGVLLNELLWPESVNQCLPIFNGQKTVCLSKDSTVRLYYTEEDDISEQIACEMKGHQLSVTWGAVSHNNIILATSGKDMNTIIWDLETQKKISNLRLHANYATDMVWANSEYVFWQTSEDLYLRIFDIRRKVNQKSEKKIGNSIPTSIDMDSSGNYLVTAHQGIDNIGWEVKLWDLRKFSDDSSPPVMIISHDQDVKTARFYYLPTKSESRTFIASSSLDETLRLTDINWCAEITNKELPSSVYEFDESVTAMTPLRSSKNSSGSGLFSDNLIVAGTDKPQMFLLEVDEQTLEIREYKSTNPNCMYLD